MTRFNGQLSVAGNLVTDINNQMISPVKGNAGDSLISTLEFTFDNSYRIEVDIFVQPDKTADLCASLYNQLGEMLQTINNIAGDVDQDYVFENANDQYTLRVIRGPKTDVTKADKENYIRQGGVRCIFCEVEDIHGGQIDIDAGVATQVMTCCGCDGTWVDNYSLVDVTDLEPPAVHTAR